MSRLYRPKVRPISLLSRGLSAALLIIAAAPRAHALQQRTYANPIDVDYRYNFEKLNQGISYRSGADPVIVVQGGKYYLFETIGDGSQWGRGTGWRSKALTKTAYRR